MVGLGPSGYDNGLKKLRFGDAVLTQWCGLRCEGTIYMFCEGKQIAMKLFGALFQEIQN